MTLTEDQLKFIEALLHEHANKSMDSLRITASGKPKGKALTAYQAKNEWSTYSRADLLMEILRQRNH